MEGDNTLRDINYYIENRERFTLEERTIIKKSLRSGLKKLGDSIEVFLDNDNHQ